RKSSLRTVWYNCYDAPPRKPTEILTGTWAESVYREGTQATYKCRPGYRTLGSIILECMNGKWESVYPKRVCMRKPCGHPGDIQFGSFDLLEDTEFLFGSRVVYKCDEGYQLVSPVNFRVCEADGWSNDVPFCEVVKCSPVTAPENGKISTSSFDPEQEFTFGQVVQFECNPGFKLKGPREIHCSTGGDWNEKEPQCVEIFCEIPRIENGNILAVKPIYKENERLQYTCNAGFSHNERGDATCTKNGWTPVMSCREITCNPPYLVNGNIQPKKDKYRGSDEISYQCTKGFYPPLTGNKAKCTSEGWLPLPRCNLRPCDYPEIENGELYKPHWYSQEYYRRLFPESIGKVMYYHCNKNYVPAQGSTSSYWTQFSCTEEGWSPVPECFRECHLYSIENGHFWPKKGHYKEDEDITVQCNYGYSLPNNHNKITCTKQGWSTETKCKKIKTCTLRNYFDNGFFSESKTYYLINTAAKYQCKEGYATTDGKKEGFITCGQQGWLNQPKCIKICDIPQFENARYNGNKTFLNPNERLEYECLDGYEITRGQTIGVKVCDVDEWPRTLECYEKSCHLPILQRNLYPDPKQDKYKVGDVLTFRCLNGLKLVGPLSVQCYHFGWSPRIPTCEQNVKCCEQPPEVVNGTLKDSNNRTYCHNDVVEYNCDLGFMRRGPKKIQCNNGEWTILPTCIEEERRCAEVPKPVHGHVQTTNVSYSHGSSIEYDCDENFTMVGSKRVTCNQGNWTQLPKYLILSTNIFNLYHNKLGNIVVNYSCNWNSEFKSTECTRGKWSPKPQCPKKESCAPPPQIPNAQEMSTIVNYEHGEKIVVFCKENYLLRGQEEIICKNGQWHSIPHCIEKQPCSKPPAIQYGAVKQVTSSEADDDNLESSTYKHNTILNYTCQEGFKMIGREEIICNMGKWSSPPQCIGIPCRKPPQIPNGAVLNELNTYEFGEGVTYKCHEGFNINGSAVITCIGGIWPNPPQCKGRDPFFSFQGQLYFLILRYSSEIFLIHYKINSFCFNSISYLYYLFHQVKFFLPSSEEVGKCGPPPPINNGDILSFALAEYAPESRVEYKCQRFYVLQGSQFVTCKNGFWTKEPTCLEACTTSNDIMMKHNIELRWRDTEKIYSRTGQELEFRCKRGFRKASNSPPFRTSCIEGKINYPRCI
uniref:Sushi domain-containing protein n=1 Tax=Vombatus ursinus TaxID=29139 RepID=A0A4X2KTH0_VOMUR